MSSVIGFLTSRWFLSFLGAALLAALVWFFGPLLSVLEGWVLRAVIVAAILLVWLAVNLLISQRRKKADDALRLCIGLVAVTLVVALCTLVAVLASRPARA